MMNNPIYLQSSSNRIDPDNNKNNTKEELSDSIETSYLNDSLPENFSRSNYEDDDDDSGFCCPCCLPR